MAAVRPLFTPDSTPASQGSDMGTPGSAAEPPSHDRSAPVPYPCRQSSGPSFDGLRALVFDFDGTLAHTRIDFAQMRARSLDYIRQSGLWTEAVASAPYVLEAIERAAAALPEPDKDAFLAGANAILEDIEVQACATGEPFPGVAEALSDLTHAGLRVAVITRNCTRAVAAFLQRYPLPIAVLLTRDDVSRVKPDPGHLLEALQRLELAPHQALMVGDHRTDVQCAVAAGVAACGVLTAGTPAHELREAGACMVAAAVPDVVALVLRTVAGDQGA
jgi:phosphoglycolate phosphatase